MATGAAELFWSPVGLLRITTEPGGLDLPESLDLSSGAPVGPLLVWLATTWKRVEIREALVSASPALCAQIETVLADGGAVPARVRRVAVSLASYLLRWQRRQTPFGLFAGVGPARFESAAAKVRCGTGHRYAVRTDAGWLGEVTARLGQCPELAARIPVVACNAIVRRGGRLVAPGAAPDAGPSGEAALEVSVRATGPVVLALDAATAPVPLGELRELLASRFPAASADQLDGVLRGLVDNRFLISALRVPISDPDALRTVCQVLHDADAGSIAEVADLVGELYGIRDALPAGPVDAVPAGVSARMIAQAPAARSPLLIDTVADWEADIPPAVAREIRDAVTVLYRLSPHPFGHPAWREYHNAFRARYGTGALVPVLDLVADSGLGLPAGFLGSARETPPRQLSERDEKVMALVQEAMASGGELLVTDPVIDGLCADSGAVPVLPPRTEVAFEIHAGTVAQLQAGRFTLEVTGTPRPASSMAARHAYLLPPEDSASVRRTFESAEPGLVPAQLSFAPRRQRSENVTRNGRWSPKLLSLAEHRRPGPDVIDLSDLAVTADDQGFDLIQLSTGDRVAPLVPNALEASVHTPPLARFLAEVSIATCALYGSFSFGAASRLPYLPRVLYRRTILSPARWLLDAAQLPGRRAAPAEWEQALAGWRARWQVPDHVALVEHDRRQPVDLRHLAHRHLLRGRLQSAGRLELRETASPEQVGWIGRAHELLLPLTRGERDVVPVSRKRPSSRPVLAAALRLPAASSVVAARLYAHPERFDDILADHLPTLLRRLSGDPAWWFHRYRNLQDHQGDQYLALFVDVGEPGAYAATAGQLADWADELEREWLAAQLTFASWQPPTGRYGHGAALDAALRVFRADSAAALAQIRASHPGTVPQALAALSFLDLATALAGDAATGREWLLDTVPQTHGPLDRVLRSQVIALAAGPGPLAETPAGRAVIAAWQDRAAALTTYARQLASQREPAGVLGPLLHLHHLRTLGAGPDVERVTGRLARALALHAQATHANS
jgi:thiopeptide-type bacteriocin biosynthesis protein